MSKKKTKRAVLAASLVVANVEFNGKRFDGISIEHVRYDDGSVETKGLPWGIDRALTWSDLMALASGFLSPPG